MIAQQFRQHLAEVISRINSVSSVIPAQRKAFKQRFSFSAEPFERQLEIWNYIWKQGPAFYTQLYAFFFLEQYMNRKELHEQLWQTSISWQEEVNDWPLCDSLAKINSQVLATSPGKVYPTLNRWNKDKNLWKRRQSVVSLLYYSRTKKVYLPFDNIAALVVPLLQDKEYYVQKGVGWALREMGNVYPGETMSLLQTYIKNISAIAFTIAIEKMTEAEKMKLKAIRKK